jgi:pimeloyl-ACP methyl ester carboxylesterase
MRFVHVDGSYIAYSEAGFGRQTPLLALIHFGANLDAWDPEVIDATAADRRVVLLGYRGGGRSGGRARDAVEDMPADAVAAITALGLSHIDLLGLSMGGMVAQASSSRCQVSSDAWYWQHRTQGGPALDRMAGVLLCTAVRSTFTPRRAATSLIFFTRSATGRAAAADYQARLKRARVDLDRRVGVDALRAQLRAVARWTSQPLPPARANGVDAAITFHGDDDTLVPKANAESLRAAFPDLELVTFPDVGHGVVSQNRVVATDRIRGFLSS